MNLNLKDISIQRKKRTSDRSHGKKSGLGFGLNSRKSKKSVFQESSSDESHDDSNEKLSCRASVNRKLVVEQEALRRRAEKAMETASSDNLYRYDAEYESFSTDNKQNKLHTSQPNENKKESRYITELLVKAKDRKYERDIIMERKIAREQGKEATEDYLGKDKFLTNSYKRILAERHAWIEKDKKKSKIEDAEDVTKKKGDTALMGFYQNLSRNIEIASTTRDSSVTKSTKENKQMNIDGNQGDNYINFEQSHSNVMPIKDRIDNYNDHDDTLDEIDEELLKQAEKATRIQKIFKARDRYLERSK